jgi:hypothetical protein
MTFMAKVEQSNASDTAAVLDDVRQARSAFETALTLKEHRRTDLRGVDPAKTHALLSGPELAGDRAGARSPADGAAAEPTGPIAEVTRRYLKRFARERRDLPTRLCTLRGAPVPPP